ncbi:hypothetical protein K1T71_011538 [Dendrolimus kikuchii]|uniref:Uncharacterized protein n=1 Tax=Dendrolimus kikuchii TaxID=765133 RepID=A0ACC1CPG1_9NEOP|nr:hypothetical protein K1T71_011538 [Dendrolimus kikuchii]
MALTKALFVLALVAVVSSSPLFGPMEHHLFGIPLPHTNNPIAHNLESLITKGLEDITGIHSRGNDKPMDMGNMQGMDMGGGSMPGMGGAGDLLGGLLGMGGGGGGQRPAASTSSANSGVDQKKLLQYIQLLQAQQKQNADASNPSSDEILKYLAQNKPVSNEKTVIKTVGGGNDDDLQQKIAALIAAEGKR